MASSAPAASAAIPGDGVSPSPTVVGDDGPFSVAVQEAGFDPGVEQARLRGWPEVAVGAGAVACFTGHVRVSSPDDSGAAIESLTLEHYPGMTERAIAAMVDEARRRFALLGARVVHRVGRLGPGEPIVLVATASSHRRDAFQSCEFLMDYLKTQAPFWKKEATAEGERWVDARVADDEALARWGIVAANAAGAAASPAAAGAAAPSASPSHSAAHVPDDLPPSHRPR